jgi:hypothetical protein
MQAPSAQPWLWPAHAGGCWRDSVFVEVLRMLYFLQRAFSSTPMLLQQLFSTSQTLPVTPGLAFSNAVG